MAAAAEGEPVIDAVLAPGDVLYLPRGFLHSATALGEISAHLTVGIHPVTRWAAAESALDLVRAMAAEDPQLRGSLPLGLDLADPAAIRDDVAAVVAGLREWLDRVDPAEVADRLRARTWAQVRPEPVTPLATSAAATALTAESVLRLRRRLRCALRDGDDGRVTLLAGRQIAHLPRRGARGADGSSWPPGAEGRRPARPGPRRPADPGAPAGHRGDRHRGATRRARPGGTRPTCTMEGVGNDREAGR